MIGPQDFINIYRYINGRETRRYDDLVTFIKSDKNLKRHDTNADIIAQVIFPVFE